MKIFSMKPGHDGSTALIETDTQSLCWSFEPEKDSFPRYEVFNPVSLIEAAGALSSVPDVFAVSGWAKYGLAANGGFGAGYYGFDEAEIICKPLHVFGREVTYFSSSHLRSHLMCAYAMSPIEQGKPCYALIWEGAMGDFYRIGADLKVEHAGNVMITPGNKYAFLYALADPTFRLPMGNLRFEDPGKLMALAGYGNSGPMQPDEQETADFLLNRDSILTSLGKEDMSWSPFYDIGLDDRRFHSLARKFSDEIFNRFFKFARDNLNDRLPLLIAGGCGLNCDWNTNWADSGLFEDVFIPPCTNDTGSAIGTAADAMLRLTGKAKLNWNVYAGQEFIDDGFEPQEDLEISRLDYDRVADLLLRGGVVAWAQGRAEIGPRALGNRSILAAPFEAKMTHRLNEIKERESFRPIAPVCREEEVGEHFVSSRLSPHMLHFHIVRNKKLKAIIHVDGSARVQTVSATQNESLHKLLGAFSKQAGAGVLCNTSLNFKGLGFINRSSDLYRFASVKGLDAFVFGDTFCIFHRE